MDNSGNRPGCNLVGDWCNGRARSFYAGSKQAGKQTNWYEKGHQLFGPKDDSPWVRVEVRYGNKLRVIDPAVLNHPENVFAGASDWHSSILDEFKRSTQKRIVLAQSKRLPVESILAEVKRNARWLRDTAAPSIALAFQFLGAESFLELVENQKLPGRLQKFSKGDVSGAYARAFKALGSGFGRLGLQPYQAV